MKTRQSLKNQWPNWTLLSLLFLLGLLLVACADTSAQEAQVDLVTPEAEPAQMLTVYNWDNYIDPAILTEFEEKFKVKIDYQTFTSEKEMVAAVEANPSRYDIFMPADYVVTAMRQKSLLAPLNKSRIPNFKNIDPTFVSPAYDPGNRHCAPYLWGTFGIGYNLKATGREIHRTADFFDPGLAGRVSLMADSRYSLGAVLIYLGYSPNTTNNAEITQARDFLIEHAQHIAAYAPDTGQDLLSEGQIDLAFEYSGDIYQLIDQNPDVHYVIPEEGSIIWTDSMCIPADAPHKELAETFINYILEAETGAKLANYIRYPSPNAAALPLINAADRQNLALYPAAKTGNGSSFLTDVGSEATQLYEQAWNEVLANHKPLVGE